MPEITDAQIEHMLGMNEWVRPVCTQMRAVAIPEPVVQKAMLYLLSELDGHLSGPLANGKAELNNHPSKADQIWR